MAIFRPVTNESATNYIVHNATKLIGEAGTQRVSIRSILVKAGDLFGIIYANEVSVNSLLF